MSTVFTKIIEGEFPARFVYRDDRVVAFLTINPIAPGHTLVVPAVEVDHWLDLDDETLSQVMAVSKKVAVAIQESFECKKVAVSILGLEVPHAHIHLVPINDETDMDFAKADPSPSPDFLDAVQAKIIAALAQ